MTDVSAAPAFPGALPLDRELFARELERFVPTKVFDAHAHLYRLHDLPTPPAFLKEGPASAGIEAYRRAAAGWLPGREIVGGLFFPYPMRNAAVAAANQFLVDELRHDSGSRGLMLIGPTSDPRRTQDFVQAHQVRGFKVYHVYADPRRHPDTFFAPCESFIPTWAWELCDRAGLALMLHLVLPRALAEPANQRYIREHCLRYPGARLILAHAGRGFCGRHTAEGIESLRGLDNVYFDTSAVCEAGAFEAILRTFGPSRLFFGSDFPVTEMRTRCVNLGPGFAWLNELGADYASSRFAKPTLLALESLLALKDACRSQHLTDGDVEGIFLTNAQLALGLTAPTDHVQDRYRQAKRLIPGGTQLLSKRPEMFAPEQWPAYYREARGCEVIDIDGRRYLDMASGGILACILGYADPEVNAAVMRRVQLGSMSTLQTDDEVELAELLIRIHPWADMARFTRGGGESMAVAVRLARAATGRDKVAFCGYHGWHDWYLSANLPVGGEVAAADRLTGHLLPGLEPAGVPGELAGSALPFHYNRLDELDRVIADHHGDLAAVVMEPTRGVDPAPGFLEGVRERCDRIGAKLVFDEISIGWRLCLGGAHLKFGVTPDLAVFAKAISNGFAMGAVIGRRNTMQAAERSFISSAYWTEGVGPAAAVATIRKLMRIDVPAHLGTIGSLMMEGWQALGRRHGVPVKVTGRPQNVGLGFDHPQSAALTTLLTVRMLQRGFLAGGYFNAMLAHEPRHVESYLAAAQDVFAELRQAIEAGDIEQRIGGPVKHTGFARLTG